jgi:mono/diheme cytochrome c family protein
MKTIKMQVFAAATAIAVVFVLSLSAHAQNASEALYKSKCAACHGANGTGSATGKKMGAHDFTTTDVQGMSDADLATIITNGKNKMPKYGASLKRRTLREWWPISGHSRSSRVVQGGRKDPPRSPECHRRTG